MKTFFQSLSGHLEIAIRSTARFCFPLRLCAGLLLSVAGLGSARAQIYSYDFNSGATNFNATFTSNGGAGNGTVFYSATNGIGGTGSISTDGVSNHSIVFNTALNNTSGTVITASFFFQTRGTLDTWDLVGVGLLGSSTLLWDAGNSVFYKVNGSNASSLVASNWYQLVATITNTGSTYHTVLTLENFGSNGTTGSGSLIYLPTSDSAGGGLLGAGSVYVGLYGGLLNYQTPAIDNFVVNGGGAVPEPASYAALAGLAALGLAFWRRRQAA